MTIYLSYLFFVHPDNFSLTYNYNIVQNLHSTHVSLNCSLTNKLVLLKYTNDTEILYFYFNNIALYDIKKLCEPNERS